MRLWTAIRAFFATLFDGRRAEQVAGLLAAPPEKPALEKPTPAKPKPEPKKPTKSEALILLEALQREARFLDFMQESLDAYDDAQIGAAVRDVHRQAREVLKRMFDFGPVVDQEEGSTVEVPAGYDPGIFRVVGNVGEPPLTGKLTHHGWKANRCDLPSWSGSADAAFVVAPAEVEVG